MDPDPKEDVLPDFDWTDGVFSLGDPPDLDGKSHADIPSPDGYDDDAYMRYKVDWTLGWTAPVEST